MLRITRTDRRSRILITIEGELAGDYVTVGETACKEALSTGIPVTVFLRDVMGIDAGGYAFLKELVLKHARLRARGIYLRHMLRSLQANRDRNGQRWCRQLR